MADVAPGVPAPAVAVGRTEPVPRRVRALLGGRTVLDTTRAVYLWEHPWYPHWWVPADDVGEELLGTATEVVEVDGSELRVAGCVRVPWSAADAWLEEDEEVFVHPRSPYVRVDALPSSRHVRVELDGELLAESASPVLVVETGLPTRYYLPRPHVRLDLLDLTDTVTQCPYKGRTSATWSVRVGGTTYDDVAWCYDFPTRQLLPIAGMVAFYNERVDLVVDGERLGRPRTTFS